MKVLFMTNIPSPYRVRFFNELARYCDLTVIYEKEKSDERDDKWVEQARDSYRSIFLKGIRTSVDGAFAPGIVRYLNKNRYDLIVISGIASPTQMLAITWCRAFGIPYCLEGDGAFPGSGKGLKEKLKHFLISGTQLAFSTCHMHDRYYLTYGLPENRIVRYPFTSVDAADVLAEPISREEKLLLRQKLGMEEDRIILSVGRFIPLKGFDTLLEASKSLPENVGLYIVGGEPTEEYLALRRNLKLNHAHFVGFQNKKSLADFYRAADVFVLPTRSDVWGLVINEAMAWGLPVISTTRCNAGLELVKSGENGFLVEPDDPQNLSRVLGEALGGDLEKMSRSALDTIRGYTIEEMARRHAEIFTEYLEETNS